MEEVIVLCCFLLKTRSENRVMNLAEHYNRLYQAAVDAIISDQYECDTLMNSSHDDRRGLTLLIRPPREVVDHIRTLLTRLEDVDPGQYYYPTADIHITVLTIISCYSGFDTNAIKVSDYVDVVKKSLEQQKDIEVEFKGITASPSGILIQGFVADGLLNSIRDDLRVNFNQSGLQQSIDKRYAIQTAHATVVRFRNKMVDKGEFLRVMERHREHSFGKFKVNTLELVENDWYHSARNEKVLHQFELK